jgi:hypothetical protein
MLATLLPRVQTAARLRIYGAFKVGLDRSRRHDRIRYSEACVTEECHFSTRWRLGPLTEIWLRRALEAHPDVFEI